MSLPPISSQVPIDFTEPGFRKIDALISSHILDPKDVFNIGRFSIQQLSDLSKTIKFSVLDTDFDRMALIRLQDLELRASYYRARFKYLSKEQKLGMQTAIAMIGQTNISLFKSSVSSLPVFIRDNFGLVTHPITAQEIPTIEQISLLQRESSGIQRQISALQQQARDVDARIVTLLKDALNPQ